MCQPNPKTKSVAKPIAAAKGKVFPTPLNVSAALDSISREDLSSLATHLGVPVGKSKKNTVDNISVALANGKARLKVLVYISTPPSPEALQQNSYATGKTLLIKKFRNYKDSKIVSPVPPVLVK